MENYSMNMSKKLVQSWERNLRQLINNWNLIPGSPKDEFDLLNHKLISLLTKGADTQKIYNVLRSELITYYGLSPSAIELRKFANDVFNWWEFYK